MEKKRILYIDLMKGLGIMLVTMGHITSLGNPVDVWGGSFKITIFFVAAGYLICYANSYANMTLKAYVLKLLKSLGVPYVIFSVLAVGYRTIVMIARHKVNLATIKSFIFASVTFRGISTLWFLPCLFVAEVLFFIYMKYLPKWTRFLMLIVLPVISMQISSYLITLEKTATPLMYERISFCTLTMSKAIVGLWFLYVGYLGCQMLRHLKSKWIRFGLGIILSLANVYVAFINIKVDFNNMRLGIYPILIFATGVLGSFGALLIFEFLEEYFTFPILSYFGKNSLVLMITQRIFMIITIAVSGWKAVFGYSQEVTPRYYIDVLGSLALLLVIEYGIITFVNTKAPFLIGRFKKSQEKLNN